MVTGGICVLVVGDLFQLPPVASSPVYMAPRNARTLNDLAPNGWDEFRLHELTQVMHQNDLTFVTALHKIRINQPANGSPEDNLLHSRELSCVPGDMSYPYDAMHVYAQNMYCDEWNEYMLGRLAGGTETCIAINSQKDTAANMKHERVSLPKTKAQLDKMHPDDDDVFATSLLDRYVARPNDLNDMCLAMFAVTYDVVSSHTQQDDEDTVSCPVRRQRNNEIKLHNGLGYMRKRKRQSILCVKRFKLATEHERYYHSKLMLYFPWLCLIASGVKHLFISITLVRNKMGTKCSSVGVVALVNPMLYVSFNETQHTYFNMCFDLTLINQLF